MIAMSDYISRREACNALDDLAAYFDNKAHEPIMSNGVMEAESKLFDVPTVDAVPVVRCGECKSGWRNGGCTRNGNWVPTFHCNKNNCNMTENDFCNYGERKDGEKND